MLPEQTVMNQLPRIPSPSRLKRSRTAVPKARGLKMILRAACLIPLSAFAVGEPADLPELKSPTNGLEEVGHQDVSLDGGFWGKRLEIHHRTTIPHVLDKLEERHHLTNFDKAAWVLKGEKSVEGATGGGAGEEALQGDPGDAKPLSNPSGIAAAEGIVGHSAFDSDVHKALEGACYTLEHFDDPALRQRVDRMLDRIIAAQNKDGYLISYFIAKDPENKWTNMRLNHELYNAGHLFEFAVAHQQLTGETKALDAAKRFADHIDSIFGPGKRYEVGGHQGIELALVKLYRTTGEKRYLDLCRFLLEERGHLHGSERKPFTDVPPRAVPKREPGQTMREYRRMKWAMRSGRMQDHKPVLEQTEAVGHAVRAGYMYAAMADLARFGEAPEYAKVLGQLWEDVVFRKMYVTGGVGTAQYGDEGFGDPYLLPNKTYCESCSSIAHVLWQHRMNLLTEDAKAIDVMELVLYNAALAGISLSGDGFAYQNPLTSSKGAQRKEWIGLACCPTNYARFTPQVGGLMYATKKDRIHVNLYAAGEASVELAEGKTVKLTQQTDYPWEGKIRIVVEPEAPSLFDLRLRIPGWALGRPVPGDLYRFHSPKSPAVSLAVNGEAVDAAPSKKGYVSIARTWKPGDVVELDLPMPVRRVLSHEKVEADRGRVALQRGPIIYCVEAIDNGDLRTDAIVLPDTAVLKIERRKDLLGGVVTITGTAAVASKTQPGKPAELRPHPIMAIPYYAWANRNQGSMDIWLARTVATATPVPAPTAGATRDGSGR